MNLANIIDVHPDDTIALISRGRSTTYGQLRAQVDRCRGGFASLGIGNDDRVVLLLSNSRQFVVAYLAALGLGAAVVPLNPTSPAPEISREIAVVGAKLVIVDKTSTASFARVDRHDVPTVQTVMSTESPTDTESATGAGSRNMVAFDDMLTFEPVERVDVEPSHVAALMFTSGTAGSPRAAMLSHANLAANISQSQSADGHIDSGDVIYGVLPAFHIFGLNVVIGLGLSVGATIVLVQRFDPATAAESIVDRQVTVIPGAPGLWSAFAFFHELDPTTFSSVRLALSGASRLPVQVAEQMLERFGIELREGYGLTEASPVVTTSTGIAVRFGSVGRALSGVQVRLVNDNGEALVGDVGEIWVRGDNVFAGYLDDPEATARVLTDDGWLKTGDMATADDEGYLYLVDRAKDLIIVSGFNVYPAEVEEVLAKHPLVVEAGVVGVAHPHTGEAVKAYVVPVAGSDLDEEAVIEFSLDHLARYKCPSKVIFVDELPRNATGKLVRRRLADELRVGGGVLTPGLDDR